MDKGAGIAMCCTFGDVTDVEWWRDLNLPLRSIIQRVRSSLVMDTPDWIEDEKAKETRPRARPRSPHVRSSSTTSCAPPVISTARADPDQAYDELLREGRQAARNRHLLAVVPEERRHRRS